MSVSAEPRIENPAALSLPAAAQILLKQLFPGYQRVIVKAELGSGFSGSRVLLVHPIADTPALPVAVKLAPASLIKQEYLAYQECIYNRLPGAAEIRSEPILPAGPGDLMGWGGLCYYLVGSGIFEIESLMAFCRRASVEEILHVLEKRLFKRMGLLWRFSDACLHFDMSASYDPLLPVNLLIRPASTPPGCRPCLLKPVLNSAKNTLIDHSVGQGSHVRLEGWYVTEVDAAQKAVTLNVPALDSACPMASYRVRLQPVEDVSVFQVGDTLDAVEGVVTATRRDLLLACAPPAQSKLLGDSLALPNPLDSLPEVLAESRHVRVARIHGDLNLANILVDADARDVHLIDFALARRDHVLHDLLRLETGIVTWLLPELLTQARLPMQAIYTLYDRLHRLQDAGGPIDPIALAGRLELALRKPFVMLAAVRKMARECLFDAGDWGEYYQGLTLYLLGALKFKNLDSAPCAPLPKQLAFLGAAVALKLRRIAPPRQIRTSVLAELPPFIVGPPILHPKQFFGRERELKRLFNLWKHTPLQNAAIIGPRRSGKTSLLWYLKSILAALPAQLRPGQRSDWLADPQGYSWVLVDFQDARMGRRAELLRHLLTGLNLPVPQPCDLDGFMEVVGRNLRAPAVILFDEIDVALQRYAELDNAFWESLRSLASNQVKGNLAFVLAAHTSPDSLARHSNIGSPFFNIFGYTAQLGPLTEPEARELIAGSPLAFAAADIEWILANSGRWPILLQILCRERFMALESGEAGEDWRQESLGQIAPFRHLLQPGE